MRPIWKGDVITFIPPQANKVVDLMDALRQSIELAKKGRSTSQGTGA